MEWVGQAFVTLNFFRLSYHKFVPSQLRFGLFLLADKTHSLRSFFRAHSVKSELDRFISYTVSLLSARE